MYHAIIAQNIFGCHSPTDSTLLLLCLNQQTIMVTSIKGFVKLVSTSPIKNSMNLTSEKGEKQQLIVAAIIGKRIKL